MTIKYVLDTDIIIDVQRGFAPALNWFLSTNPKDIGIPGYVQLELVQFGRNKADVAAALKIIEDFAILWPSDNERNWVLTHFANLHLAHGIGPLDMLIAATAISHSSTLCTSNIKHYRDIADLLTLQPYRK